MELHLQHGLSCSHTTKRDIDPVCLAYIDPAGRPLFSRDFSPLWGTLHEKKCLLSPKKVNLFQLSLPKITPH